MSVMSSIVNWVDERLDFLDRHALRGIQDGMLHRHVVVPLRGVLEIREDHLAVVAIAGIEPLVRSSPE